jgi:hypothetical protein
MRLTLCIPLVLTIATVNHAAFAANPPNKSRTKPAAIALAVPPSAVTPVAAPAPVPPSPAYAAVLDAPPTTWSAAAPAAWFDTSPHAEQPAIAVAETSAGAGFVLSVAAGMTVLGGGIAQTWNVGAILSNVELKLGGYLSPHVGIMAGIQGAYGTATAGCVNRCGSAVAFQFPIVSQYAFQDRTRGVFLEAGIAVLPTYLASSGDSQDYPRKAPETLTVSAPFDVKLGLGYRIAGAAEAGKAANASLEIRFGVDIGEFKSVQYATGSQRLDLEIDSEKRTLHGAVFIGLGYQYAP